jgi:hypothetical protein
MPRRTVRKPTRWTAEEWARVTDAARARGVPPLRYVREAALGAAPTPASSSRRKGDELVLQLARILNNLRQLQRIAEEDGQDGAAALIEATAEATDAAIRTAPSGAREAAPLLAALVPVGVALNELAHRANTAEELPPEGELLDALAEVEAAVRRVGP